MSGKVVPIMPAQHQSAARIPDPKKIAARRKAVAAKLAQEKARAARKRRKAEERAIFVAGILAGSVITIVLSAVTLAFNLLRPLMF